MTIKIRMTSDFICPWCLIGDRRLQAAIDSLPEGIDVSVDWLPFALNPDMPLEGLDRRAYRSAKFGSWERSQALDAQTVTAGAADGIAFDYPAIQRTPNTFAAHRLSRFAARRGQQAPVVRAILSAYFEQGRDIGDLDVLADIASEAGLDRAEAATFLAGNEGTEELRALIAQAPTAGIRGVPHFDIGGTIVTGAQRPERLRDAILTAHARLAA